MFSTFTELDTFKLIMIHNSDYIYHVISFFPAGFDNIDPFESIDLKNAIKFIKMIFLY